MLTLVKKKIEYTNRRGNVYYLYQGTTKTGKPKYYFAMTLKDDCLQIIPKGFEIYENPNAQVFLIKKEPPLISNDEKQVVISALKANKSIKHFMVDIKKKYMTIYVAEPITFEASSWRSEFRSIFKPQHYEMFLNYMGEMRFTLIEENIRQFTVERFCHRGSVDDWILLGSEDQLHKLVEKFVPHLGKDSYYDLYEI